MAKERKKYMTALVLYKKDRTRLAPGQPVYEDELEPGIIPSLLESAALTDPDEKIAPSQASAQLAHELLASMAVDGRLVTVSDGVYAFGERKVAGDIKAFCAAVPIEELRAAMVKAIRAGTREK